MLPILKGSQITFDRFLSYFKRKGYCGAKGIFESDLAGLSPNRRAEVQMYQWFGVGTGGSVVRH